MAIINPYPHVRGNANYYGMSPTENPLYDWRGVTVSSFYRDQLPCMGRPMTAMLLL
jgi:hypothetical protein